MARYFSRGFLLGCSIYLLAVALTFLLGIATSSPHSGSWTFLPTCLLTLPWFPIAVIEGVPERVSKELTAFYDLPLFALSAFLNLLVAAGVRRLFRDPE